MPHQKGGKSRGGANNKSKKPMPRDVQISKNLTFILRHGADAEGIPFDEGGWANVQDILAWRRLSGAHVTFEELRDVVENNDKQRFSLKPNPHLEAMGSPPSSPYAPRTKANKPADDPSRFLIRAAQGHSIPGISSEQIHTPILATDPDCPFVVVHGTNHARWLQIHRSGHLNRMSRNHIHFARDELRPLPPLSADDQPASRVVQGDEEEVISGMRRDSTVMIWVDVRASLAAGVKWWRSTNDVILTEGLDGKLPLDFVAWTEKRGGEEVLFGNREAGLKMKALNRRPKPDSVGEKKDLNGDPVSGLALPLRRAGENSDMPGGPGYGNGNGISGRELTAAQRKDHMKPSNGNGKAAVKDNWDDGP